MFIVLSSDAAQDDGRLWALVPEFDDPLSEEAWYWQHGFREDQGGDMPLPRRRGPAEPGYRH